MDSSVFKQYYKDIKAALEEQQLNRALSLEENLLYTNPSWPFLDEVISIRQAYQGLLGCMENGFRDDNRKDSFHHLLSRAYKLLHLLRRYYYKEQPKSLYSKSCLSVRRESYLAYQTILEKTTEIREEQNNKDVLRTILLTREQCMQDLFLQIWTTGSFSELDTKELYNLLHSENIRKNDRLLCISALLLQQSLCPDARILSILIGFSTAKDIEVKIRAIVGWLLLLMMHEKEYLLDGHLKEEIQEAFEDKQVQQIVCEAINNFYLSLESRDLINKLQNEILPLINNEKLFSGTEEEAQKLLKTSMKKVQQLLNSGADIQFGSFIQDKNYSFFKHISNWLLPFDMHHSDTEFELREDKPSVSTMKVLLSNPALCDNDKWSLFFKTKNLNIPLNIQGLNPEEMDMIDNTVTPEICTRNYIHDLFRLYNLFPFRMELVNLLKQDFSPVTHTFLQKLLDQDHLFLMARILFSNKVFTDCINIAHKFLKEEKFAFAACKLIADSYRLSQDYKNAINYYEQACNIKQEENTYLLLAQCYKQIRNYKEAAAIYHALIENAPEDISICKQYVSCLIKSKDTQAAIPLLYKIAYLDEKEQDFAQGSLAWCYLLEDKLEEAWAAWEKISKKTLTDMLNGGHICWAIKDYKNAMDFYKYYLKNSSDREKAEEQMLSDIKYMKKYQLTKLELRLILEINA